MGSLLRFWGLRVPSGKKVAVEVDEDRLEMVHVSQVALGPKPGTTQHCVMISDAEHNEIVVCTLGREHRQSTVEFVLSSHTTIHHTGDSDVYLSGFKSYDGDDVDDDDDDQLPAANGVPSANGRVTVPAASDGDEDEEDEDEDDDSYAGDEDEEMSEGGSDLDALEFDGDEDEEEEGDEDEEGSEEGEEGEESEEEPTLLPKSAKKRPADLPASTPASKKQATAALTPAPAKKQGVQVKEAPGTAPAKVGVKGDTKTPKTPKTEQKTPKGDTKTPKAEQKTPKGDAKTPKTDQKTPKGDTKTPKSDQKTPKTPATPATPGSVPEFITALKEVLQGGPMALADLGSRVKRPKEVQKLKGFFLQHAEMFAVSDDKVSLK